MAKTIALNLTINGVKQSISNINELETAVKTAEETLKGLSIGSEEFKRLSSDIKNAKGVLEDFQESIKGQELEKRVGAFAKVGEAITSSFAGAQAAFALFGGESEEVAKAAAKAQAVLTIALTARSVAEGVVQLRTVAQTIATYASAAAANSANVATRTLYATLAANPYGAILAVIGLIITALITFTGETKEATNVTKELAQAQSDEASNLRQSLLILTQYNSLKSLQKQTIEELKKEYPGFNAFLDKENKLTEEGIKFIKLRIKQYELEAQTKLILQKIAENNIKILEIEAQGAIETVTFWQKLAIAAKNGSNVAGSAADLAIQSYKNQQAAIAEVNASNEKWRKELERTYVETDKVVQEIKPYNEQLERQNKLNEKNAESEKNRQETIKKNKEAFAAGRSAIISFTDELKKLDELQKQYTATIDTLLKLKYDVKIIEDLNKIKEARKAATQELVKFSNDYIDSINKLSQALPEDVFLKIFSNFRDNLEQAFVSGQNNFREIYQQFIDQNKNLSQQQKQVLFDVFDGYEKFGRLVEESPGFRKIVENFSGINAAFDDFRGQINITEKGAKGFLLALGDISAAAGDFKLELDQFGNVQEFPFDINNVRKNSRAALYELRQNLFKPTVEALLEQKERGLIFLEYTAKPEDLANIKGQLSKVREVIDEFKKTGRVDANVLKLEDVDSAINKTIENFQKLLGAIVKAEQEVFKVNLEVQKLTQELQKNPEELSKAIGGAILQNIDAISTLLLGARTKEQKIEEDFVNKIKKDRDGLEKFKQQLADKGIDISKVNNNDLLQAYIVFKKKEVEVTKQAEKDKQDAQQETYQKISKGLELFSQTLGQVSALSRERIQTDLELLQVSQKTALEQVVGDTESANQKRLEIQAEYEQKRKEIEKKGRLDSLRFSLVQSIANTAQAVVKSLAELGPILGPILAGVNSAIGVAQIAIIQDQISAAQALRRGGLIRAQGGLLTGPSHELGGIPIPSMGVVAEGNESIINRQSTVQYQDLLSAVNMAGGGRPLVYNNFDDSRIVEALAKQNAKPIRAYVLGSEITNEQVINQRLDDLSKF